MKDRTVFCHGTLPLIGLLSLTGCTLPPATPDPLTYCMGNHATAGLSGFDQQNVYNPKCLKQMEQAEQTGKPSPAPSNP